MKHIFTNYFLQIKKTTATFCLFFFIAGFSAFSHTVTGYTTQCSAGPIYTIDATVTNVNSSSNYAWQYKNTAGVWICLVNGNNTINGNVFNISGATSTATTNPAPIVFTNPSVSLNGLVIRCVISDGTGVNPCNTPSGNTWNSDASSVNQILSVSGTPCGPTSSCLIGGVNFGDVLNYYMVFTNGSSDANWQSASKGFVGNVVVNGNTASLRTSGSFAYAGTIFTNSSSLNAWQDIVDNNPGQAYKVTNQSSLVNSLQTSITNVFSQINALSVTSGFDGVAATALNNLNTTNNIAQTFVINVNSGFGISSKINITGDANDIFILRWDTDKNPANGYQGEVKFQSGGAIVPLGGLKPNNFIHVAGDINASGGGSNPASPYPQGPRVNNGTGNLIPGASNFSGGGFFTGYWFTTGEPSNGHTAGATGSLSNAIFVGGWYSTTTKFSMTSGTSGVYIAPVCGNRGSSISGNVFNDKDGLKDNNVNQSAGVANAKTNIGGALYANLLNSAGLAVASTPVSAAGTYKFDFVASGNYTVQLSTNSSAGSFSSPANAPATLLPAGWVNTGEYIGSTAGSDGTVNGRSSTIVLTDGDNVTEVNFGVERVPESLSFTVEYPIQVNSTVTLNSAPFYVLSGSDPEDMPATGSLAGRTVKIDSLPLNSQLIYNGIPVTLGQVITNYTTSLLKVKFTEVIPSGGRTAFKYSFIDAAGFADPTPATYTIIPNNGVLAINLTEFIAAKNNCFADLNWKTSSEINSDKFVVEVSTDANSDFKTLGIIAASTNSSVVKNYKFNFSMETGVGYYFRLKMVNKNGTFKYSEIRKLSCIESKIAIAPNPVVDMFKISGLEKGRNTISIYNNEGKLMQTHIVNNTFYNFDMSYYPAGLYMVRVVNDNGTNSINRIVKINK